MAIEKKGRKASTSVNVSLRLDPKTKYLIDLLARSQKRTITGVIELAVEKAAYEAVFCANNLESISFMDAIDTLWSTDEAIRLVRLANSMNPSLLDYEELRVWETVKASPDFWKQLKKGEPAAFTESNLDLTLLQEYWDHLVEHVEKNKLERAVVPFRLSGFGIKWSDLQQRGHVDLGSEIPF